MGWMCRSPKHHSSTATLSVHFIFGLTRFLDPGLVNVHRDVSYTVARSPPHMSIPPRSLGAYLQCCIHRGCHWHIRCGFYRVSLKPIHVGLLDSMYVALWCHSPDFFFLSSPKLSESRCNDALVNESLGFHGHRTVTGNASYFPPFNPGSCNLVLYVDVYIFDINTNYNIITGSSIKLLFYSRLIKRNHFGLAAFDKIYNRHQTNYIRHTRS